MPSFDHLSLEIKDHIAWLRLNRPPLNDLNPEVLDELIAAHNALAEDDDVWMVVLGASGDKFFCNGVSPDFVLERDVDGRALVFERLFDLMRVMYAFPKIELCAIRGHAMAGGAVLAILCDFRFMAAGKNRLGFSEVPVGLTVPEFLIRLIEGVTGPQHLVKVAMLGTAFRPEEALAIGLVDRVVDAEDLDRVVEDYLRGLCELPLKSMQDVKASIRAPRLELVRAASGASPGHLRHFLTGNFDEGLRAVQERRRPNFANP